MRRSNDSGCEYENEKNITNGERPFAKYHATRVDRRDYIGRSFGARR
jgi:hypothetical protein